MYSKDFSIFVPLTAFPLNETHKGEAPKWLGPNGLLPEPRQAESPAPSFAFFPNSGRRQSVDPFWRGLSPWTCSRAKRVFDCACVLLALPALIPLFLVVAAAVALTSRGPILFLQERAGMNGLNFTIFKFRTMLHAPHEKRHAVTTLDNQQFTPIGSFLRRWKLDELPQLVNVLLGQMSMVGPRPKMRDHMLRVLPCRPGITSGATIAFAQEAVILAPIPGVLLNDYYRDVILPAKRQMDAEYFAQATFLSDLGLLINSVLRRWNTTAANNFITAAEYQSVDRHFRQGMEESASVGRCSRLRPIREN